MKHTLFANIGDINWKISYQHSYVEEHYRDYRIDPVEDAIPLEVTEERLQMLQKLHQEMEIGYLEGDGFYQQMATIIPQKNRFLMHGAAIAYGKDGFLFTAPSGTGKSTHISLWRKYLGNAVSMINGDKPIIAVEKDQILVYGTPWGGKENWQKNCKRELKAVCVLKQAKKNAIMKIEPSMYLPILMQQIYLPDEKEAGEKTLYLVNELLTRVPFYLLECDMSKEAVRCSFERMTGQKMEDQNED